MRGDRDGVVWMNKAADGYARQRTGAHFQTGHNKRLRNYSGNLK